MGRRNSWGYNTKEVPFSQLLTLLGVSSYSEIASTLRSRLRALTALYLDSKHPSKEQPQNLLKIWKKVSKEYPQLFPKLNTEDTVERMFLVFHIVVRTHNDRRKPSRKKNYRKPKNIQVAVQKPEKPKKRIGLETIARQLELADRDVIELTDSDPEESDREIDGSRKIVEGPTVDCTKAAAMMQSALTTKSSFPLSLSPRATVKPSTSYKTISSYFGWTDRPLENYNHSQGLTSSSQGLLRGTELDNTTADRNFLTGQRVTNPRNNVELSMRNTKGGETTPPDCPIRKFFSTCQPSMVYLAGDFVRYGCMTEARLQKLAQFPHEKRMLVLRKIFASRLTQNWSGQVSDDDKLTEMDLDVLDDDLVAYFEN